MKYAIAPLELADRVRWQTLWSEYQLFYRVDLPTAVTESTWQRLHSGRVRGLGARDPGGQLLGIVHFLFHEDTWSTAPACYLQDLYVDQVARGTGCARRLIEAVADSARSAGASDPYWLTHETNVVARQLYDRLGKNQGFIQYVYSRENAPAS
jgi:GNAT superfamily N-acetyltransferase